MNKGIIFLLVAAVVGYVVYVWLTRKKESSSTTGAITTTGQTWKYVGLEGFPQIAVPDTGNTTLYPPEYYTFFPLGGKPIAIPK
jgi:hypothetical protein